MVNLIGNLFNKEPYKTYLSEDLDIGYTLYGPTLGLAGTITATEKVVFINTIIVIVRRLYDGASFFFNWFAFRPHHYSGNQKFEIDLKMPSKFIVAAHQAHTFNILFSDQNQYSIMNSDLKILKQRWEDVLEKFSIPFGSPESTRLFGEFLKREDITPHYDRLLKSCFWEEGNYALLLSINPQEAKNCTELHRLFALTGEDVRALRMNTPMIIADLCRQPDIRYHTVQSKLKI